MCLYFGFAFLLLYSRIDTGITDKEMVYIQFKLKTLYTLNIQNSDIHTYNKITLKNDKVYNLKIYSKKKNPRGAFFYQ